ncbi:MAG: undecaprenyl/decaprenyl-phosphate alpha-N-acetylglucosaminyl 1-phosphate transferase, partial [Maribacter sp.]|nr:undecaprenyl/decaprenyl-phosphate alpha-N-acetylglucosaminyl 1-phosphate transferase [Maribacter sp.]
MTYLKAFLANPYFLGCLAMVAAFLLSMRLYPVIIYLGRKRNLLDEPQDRSTHLHKTPTLGGVGLFISFSLTLIFL